MIAGMRDNFLEATRRECPVCGREFWAGGAWVYKKGYSGKEIVFCSWRCLRKDERKNLSLGDRINQAIRDGLSDAEIRKLLNVTQHQIDYRKERKTW